MDIEISVQSKYVHFAIIGTTNLAVSFHDFQTLLTDNAERSFRNLNGIIPIPYTILISV
jgi:hypothetical protein